MSRFIAPFVSLACAFVLHPGDQPTATESRVTLFRGDPLFESGLASTFRVTLLPPVGIDESWREEGEHWIANFMWHKCRYRFETTSEIGNYGERGDGGSANEVHGWNGTVGWIWRPDAGEVQLRSEDRLDISSDSFFLFNACDAPSFCTRIPLNEAVAEWKPEILGSNTTRYFVELGDATTIDCTVDSGENNRLVTLSHMTQEASTVRSKIEFAVESWAEYGDLELPKRARRDSYMFHERLSGIPPQKLRVLFDRIDARRLSEDERAMDSFDPPSEVGMRIIDQRLNLVYEIGSSHVYLDGFRYRMPSPIDGIIGAEELSSIVPASAAGAGDTVVAISTDVRIYYVWLAVCIMAIVAAGIALQRMRARKERSQ